MGKHTILNEARKEKLKRFTGPFHLDSSTNHNDPDTWPNQDKAFDVRICVFVPTFGLVKLSFDVPSYRIILGLYFVRMKCYNIFHMITSFFFCFTWIIRRMHIQRKQKKVFLSILSRRNGINCTLFNGHTFFFRNSSISVSMSFFCNGNTKCGPR